MPRLLPFTLLATLAALAGCQQRSQPAVDEQAFKTFTNDMQRALYHSITTADTDEHLGVVLLTLKLDRTFAPVACKARRAPLKYEQQLPAGFVASNYEALNQFVETQCWKTVYPEAPAQLFDEDGTLTVVAPIYLMLPGETQSLQTERGQYNARKQFLWQHLLRDQPVNSIGMAMVNYQANAQGKVDGCLVQLYPHPLRKDAFRLEGELQARLTQRCMALDLSQMPGFATGGQGDSVLDYAPWRVGRP
ncbi:hypothetical protein [Pseudomonas sp. PSKL.D1]|uniref:hypothetical protein n=1 Tax=Pseudomonas sp. PSKL.D1 TaxID=3029060 RepID=UPI0023815F4E|nr:hypothetical protein [Pseudomonas sp. PSKL.D1]WDY56022.1 hypothetical protein PVV54_15585 [Pseudomonas sp. PSKL.D1]